MQDWSFKLLGRASVIFAIANCCLMGCSSTIQTYQETLQIAFFIGEDVKLTLTEIQQRNVPGLYVRKNNDARALLSLRQSETQIQKWVSADDALIVLQQGRVVKLLGFDEQQMLGQTVRQQDWLTKPISLIHLGDRSHLISDWLAVQHQGVESRIEVVAIVDEQLNYFEHAIQAVRVDERVEFGSGEIITNSFWFSKRNGMLLKSRQQPLANWSVFELEYISDIANNLSVIGMSNI